MCPRMCRYRLGVISNHVTSWLEHIFTQSGYDAVFCTTPEGGMHTSSQEAPTGATNNNDTKYSLSPLVVVSDMAKCGKPNEKIYK